MSDEMAGDRHSVARRQRVCHLARLIWAEKAALLQSPLGERVPLELWQKYLPHAEAIMLLIARPE
jgi:hypothetical protein